MTDRLMSLTTFRERESLTKRPRFASGLLGIALVKREIKMHQLRGLLT